MSSKTILGSQVIEILQQSKCTVVYFDKNWAPILVEDMEYGYERSKRVQDRLQEDPRADDEDDQEDDEFLLNIGGEFYLIALDKNDEYRIRDNGIEVTVSTKSQEGDNEIKGLLVPMITNHALSHI